MMSELKPGEQSNERLEFLGDSILGAVAAELVFFRFPHEDEGPLTQKRSNLVSRKSLNRIGEAMGLGDFIQTTITQRPLPSAVVGNALEALIGAIYLDHGFKKAQRAVLLMLKHYGLDEQVNETHDFKSQLHQWATKRKKKLAFEVLKDDDAAGEERYEIAAKVNGEVYGIGIGRSKKLAEQEAARRAWKKVYDRRTASGGGAKRGRDDKSQESSSEGRRSRGAGSSRRRRPSKPKSEAANAPQAANGKASEKASAKEGGKPRSGRSRSRRSGGNKPSESSNSAKA